MLRPGVSAQAYGYDAFGNIVTQSGSSTNDNKFLTKEMDASGLIYFGARYYDPRIGRFISADPSGMTDGPNLYVYCKNDPVNAVDLWGLCVKLGFKRIPRTLLYHTGIKIISSKYGTRSWGFNPVSYSSDVLWGKTVPGKIYINEGYDFYITISQNSKFVNNLFEILSSKENLPAPNYDLYGTDVNNCYTWRNKQLIEAANETFGGQR
ncbi:MAG: RHS repeat-associated core domain-containing protein [Candidatus Omnitrophota bacterium]